MKIIVSLCAVLALDLAALQLQSTFAADKPANAIDALPHLVGTYEGEGWIRQGSSPLHKFRSLEIIERRAGGKILTIVGKHTAMDTGQVIHEAFAIVSPGSDAQSYRFQTFTAAGEIGDFQGRLENGEFIWERPAPGGAKIRFVARIANDQWDETGFYSSDGAQWHEFFKMSLKHVSADTACKGR